MYDRAPRDLVQTFGSTPHNVGPGSYDASAANKARLKAGMDAILGCLNIILTVNFLLIHSFCFLYIYAFISA